MSSCQGRTTTRRPEGAGRRWEEPSQVLGSGSHLVAPVTPDMPRHVKIDWLLI